ncbi:MAG: flavin monoamine oxidase family protein [Planctomycetota bacterium]
MATFGVTHTDNTAAPAARRVAIIGAGFGGLAAGWELSRSGYYVVDVFEARNRLGGRVHSVDRFAPNRMTEFGGEFIGGNHPFWLRLARHFGIELESLDSDEKPAEVIMDGHHYSGDEARALAEEVNRGHVELARDAALAVPDEPWNTPDAETYDRMSLKQRIEGMNTTPRAKRAIFIEFLHDMACHPGAMNYLALMCVIKGHGVEKYWTETEMFRARSGNQILASHLAAGISGRIHPDCPVVRIEQDDHGCRLTLRDGRMCAYPDVVMSVPPSVWHDIEFIPGLPAGFRPQMGSATKFLSVVRNAYWLPDGETDVMTDRPLGMTWEGASSDSADERLLCSFAGGTIADDLHSRPFAGREKLLDREFNELLPGFHNSHIKSEFVDWIGDQWMQGGYSFPQPGAFLSQARILNDGIGRMHFAGEHASFSFFGFMEGGLHSGFQAAHRLMQRDRIAIPEDHE